MIGSISTGAALLLGLAMQSTPTQVPADLIDSVSPSTRSEVADTVRRLKEDPGNAALLGRMGMLLQANQSYDTAIEYYGSAIGAAPGEFSWIYYRAICNEAVRRLDEAERDFAHAVEIDPGYIPARIHLAQILADSGRWAEARTAYGEIVARFPDLAVAQFGLARSLEELGREEEAEEHYARACRLHPSFGAAHYALAQLLRKKGDPDGAREHLERYQEYKLNRPVVGDGLIQAIEELKSGDPRALRLFRQAVTEAEKGNTQEAIDLNREAIEISPDLVQAYLNLLVLYGNGGRFQEAEATYWKGVKAAENFEQLHYNFGVLLLRNERPFEARDAFLKALQINPLNADSRINLGQIEELRGDFAEAERHYRAAIEFNPNLRLARFNLARLLIARGQPGEGAAELEKIRTPEDDQTPLYLYVLATARVREGKLEAALEAAEEAWELADRFGRTDLILVIDRDLEKLRAALKK